MKNFHLKLDSITDIIVLESMREELASNAHSIDVTWHERNFIYEKIQAIVCRLMNLE
ncbi:hypothetical protein J31TS6_11480 [Brevibacillus reuszeri]|nr:hypothetical protein J31TS6_11480 [Brevibacillus reuszeri]